MASRAPSAATHSTTNTEPTEVAGVRGRRVAELIKQHLTDALLRELGDRRLQNLVVTEVELPDDLGTARVLVRSLQEADEAERRQTMRALARVASRLRKSLAPKLRLKRVPELKFAYDVGADHARRVDELLREIESESAATGGPREGEQE